MDTWTEWIMLLTLSEPIPKSFIFPSLSFHYVQLYSPP
ncbi:hypothetical protein POX_b02119 [Penicillium oxalicum]|nr:hypothetical protein POX_b02119 [Penicillium oxalicum]KAI2792084.1 hypothetical protein POX_b02119 [Penicillium oxalicum]